MEDGGTLLIAGLEDVRTVERDRGAFESLANRPATGGVRQVGKGKIIEIGEDPEDLDGTFPAGLDARDGVLVSAFKGGTLVFNRTDRTVEEDTPGRAFPRKSPSAPSEFRWIGHRE